MKNAKTGRMKKWVIVLAAAAFCMITAASVKEAAAYFTTYVSAGGSHIVNLGSQTKIYEDVKSMHKQIVITNTSQINDCYVRVKVFSGDWLEITYTDKSESGNLWAYSEADGYWYYGPILPAGASTEILDAYVGNLPEDFDQDSFNVIVIQECTPVVYDKDGNPTADWSTVYTDYQETQGKGADQS